MKNEKGMTLVALIISLLVMIILAGIIVYTVVENTNPETEQLQEQTSSSEVE